MNFPFSHPHKWLLFLALPAALLLSGCIQTHPKPQLVYHRDGRIEAYKRYERYPQRDFRHHFVRRAYRVPEGDFELTGPDQETILETWGRPDYVRDYFISLEDEKVMEWIYLDQQTLYQFVNRELVYEGPVTDFEQLLLRKGYPDRSAVNISQAGLVRQYLYYRNILLPGRFETYSLTNGWIVHQNEGN